MKVVTIRDVHKCYADGLATVIASMFDGRQLLEVSHQLYELIFEAKQAYLIERGEKSLQSELRKITERYERMLYAYSEELAQSVKAKDYSYSDLKSKQGDIEEFIADLVAGEEPWCGSIEECIEEVTQMKCLAALTDFREQVDIHAGDSARESIGDILDELRREEAFVGTLGTQDIHRIIKDVYLNITYIPEIQILARLLGHHDIIEKCRTPIDRKIAKWRQKAEQTRLLTVLSNRIAQKSQQIP